jgi:hypothetical protein|tara:strand:- start:214 stop:531 length:318 start_codon:yes stop_codon:yes gene_type:complete
VLVVAPGLARRITRLLESTALGTAGADVAAVSASAAFTGAESIIAQAAASAVKVASFGDLEDALLERVAFIKIITLFSRYLFINRLIVRIYVCCKIVQIFNTLAN